MQNEQISVFDIFKKGSAISAAMGGCQAEIGVSSAMGAAALTECLGGSQGQVLMAAEIKFAGMLIPLVYIACVKDIHGLIF